MLGFPSSWPSSSSSSRSLSLSLPLPDALLTDRGLSCSESEPDPDPESGTKMANLFFFIESIQPLDPAKDNLVQVDSLMGGNRTSIVRKMHLKLSLRV